MVGIAPHDVHGASSSFRIDSCSEPVKPVSIYILSNPGKLSNDIDISFSRGLNAMSHAACIPGWALRQGTRTSGEAGPLELRSQRCHSLYTDSVETRSLYLDPTIRLLPVRRVVFSMPLFILGDAAPMSILRPILTRNYEYGSCRAVNYCSLLSTVSSLISRVSNGGRTSLRSTPAESFQTLVVDFIHSGRPFSFPTRKFKGS